MKNTNTNATEDVDIVVNNFLEALETKNYSVISNLLAEDIVYKNVSLPTFKGKKLVNTLLKFAFSNGLDLQVKNLNIAVNGNVVLTERIDVVVIGPLHAGFWVCGTFEVENGKIKLWRDYFDWLNVSKGLVKGMAGIFFSKFRVDLNKER